MSSDFAGNNPFFCYRPLDFAATGVWFCFHCIMFLLEPVFHVFGSTLCEFFAGTDASFSFFCFHGVFDLLESALVFATTTFLVVSDATMPFLMLQPATRMAGCIGVVPPHRSCGRRHGELQPREQAAACTKTATATDSDEGNRRRGQRRRPTATGDEGSDGDRATGDEGQRRPENVRAVLQGQARRAVLV